MEIDRKKLLIILVSGAVVFCLAMGFVVFGAIKTRRWLSQDTEQTVDNPTAQEQENQENNEAAAVRIDGIQNLYFLSVEQREMFKQEVLSFLNQKGIEHTGVIMQVDQVSSTDGVFGYYLYVPGSDVYLKGQYFSNTRVSAYEVVDEKKEVEALEAAPYNPAVIDYQEAPEEEPMDMPVNISYISSLSAHLTSEQQEQLKTQLEAFLNEHYEYRRELIVRENSTKQQENELSFVLDFATKRLDEKSVAVKYSENAFSFNIQKIE